MKESKSNYFIDINKLSTELLNISDDKASHKRTKNSWSQKEILGHLIDSANVNYYRFIMALSKDNLVFDTYPQDEWVKLQSYNSRSWSDLIQLWESTNFHIAELIKNIPGEKINKITKNHNFDKICWKVVGKNEKSSLDYLVKDYIGHLDHHLKQIFSY